MGNPDGLGWCSDLEKSKRWLGLELSVGTDAKNQKSMTIMIMMIMMIINDDDDNNNNGRRVDLPAAAAFETGLGVKASSPQIGGLGIGDG